MNLAFSHALCVLICAECGAAVSVPAAGGKARCGVCDAELVARPPRRRVPRAPRISERERLSRLAAQDGALPPVPDEVVALCLDGAGLDPALGDRAMRLWQERRAQPDGAASVLHLTFLLDGHMRPQRDDQQRRALLESAALCLERPELRQLILAELAYCAAQAGDVHAADEWLADCDPGPYELHADSAYRFAAAYLALQRQQPERALEIAGRAAAAMPVAPRLDARLTALRAQALERLGDVTAATTELVGAFGRAGSAAVERAVADVGAEGLAKALPRARALAPRPPSRRRAELPWMIVAACCYALSLLVEHHTGARSARRLDALFLMLALAATLPVFMAGLARRRR